MIHPDTQVTYVNDQIGHAVFATKFIPAGTIVYVQDEFDIVINPDSPLMTNPLYRQQIDKYAVVEPPNGQRIMSWDGAKYVNHCCHGNTISTGYGFEIALRDIQIGEEIRDDYALFNLEWDIPLTCEQSNCRGHIKAGNMEALTEQWDAQIKGVLQRITAVSQPLWSLLDNETETALQTFLQTGQAYWSVAQLQMAPQAA